MALTHSDGSGHVPSPDVAPKTQASGMDAGSDTSSTADFPTTNDALQRNLTGLRNGTVSVLAADGSALVYSTYLGGNDLAQSQAIALHPPGCGRAAPDEPGLVDELLTRPHRARLCDIYVAGATRSQNFPTTDNAAAHLRRLAASSARTAAVCAMPSWSSSPPVATKLQMNDDGAGADR